MPVPFIDLKRYEPDFVDRWMERVRDITVNTRFVGGPDVARLEQRLAQRGATAAAVGCANGTDALQLALRAAGVGAGDLVLIPDATFWATFEAVVNVGARPVTVDIELDSLQMDFDLFCQAATDFRPKAAIIVNLYGWGSRRLPEFRAFCKERGITLIEDSAQAWGVTLDGEPITKGAEYATISFYPAKVIGACGDSGAVLCDSTEKADLVRRLGNHGRTSHYGYGHIGWNSRMGGLDAAWLDLCLDYEEPRLASRRASAQWYYENLAPLDVRMVIPPTGYVENGYLNVTLHEPEARPRIEAVLKECGIGFGNVYPGSMSMQPGAEGYIAGRVGGAKAEWLSGAVLNLPLFAYMREEELQEVLSAVKKALVTA